MKRKILSNVKGGENEERMDDLAAMYVCVCVGALFRHRNLHFKAESVWSDYVRMVGR